METLCAGFLQTLSVAPDRSLLAMILFLKGAPPPPSAFDPAVVAAWIGAGSAVLVALIAGGFAVYQTKKNDLLEKRRAQLEKEHREEQLRHEEETRKEQLRHEAEHRKEQLQHEAEIRKEQLQHEAEIREKQFEYEKEMERFRRELEKLAKGEESDQERQEKAKEAARIAMLRAQTQEERVKAYRQSLCADPRIAQLQILDMTQPLDVTAIYVRLRVHQDTRLTFRLEAQVFEADLHPDPNVLLKRNKELLEQRVASALAPEEALRSIKRCVVVGDPGAGKSTLLKHLTLLAGSQKFSDLPNLPVHIELHAFANSGKPDLLDFAASVWEDRYGFAKNEALAYLQETLETGQVLLFCDALDETVTGTNRVEAEASYQRVSEAIVNIATRYPSVPIMVTARKAGYHQRSRLMGFTEVEVLDFRQEDIVQFVERWFAVHSDPQKRANAQDLIARLERNSRIAALATNPLLLSLIVLVYEKQLDLPERRAELYKQCVEILLSRWDSSRNIRRLHDFKPEHKRQLLEEVAWHFHLQGQRYFSEPELLEQIAAFLPAVGLFAEQKRLVLDEIAAENGLLKEQAHGWHGFLHLTLQEYFVAQYAADHHQEFQTLVDKRDDPWWEEVLLLYTGSISDASGLLQRLMDGEGRLPEVQREDLFHTDLLLAGRCLATSPTVRHAQLREDLFTRLFEVLQWSPYALTQRQTARTLAEIGGKAVQDRLLALLPNKQVDSSVRGSIAGALGALGERAVAGDLLALLADEQVDSSVRGSIAGALGALGERAVAGDLLALLADEQVDFLVRMSIAGALGALGERAVARDLLALLADKQVDSDVRRSIAGALGALGERAVVPGLLALLADEQVDSSVRMSIAWALGALGEWAVAGDLLALLADEQVDSSVRGSIAGALGALGERAVVPGLLALLADEQVDSSVRMSIAGALGVLGERAVVRDLLALLADEQVEFEVRGSIAGALGALGEWAVAGDLLALLADEQVDSSVRGSIAGALGALGERAVVPGLLALLADEQVDSSVRTSIANILPSLVESTEQVQALAVLLPGSDIADSIHRALWALSRRLGLRIFLHDGVGGREVEVVKAREASQNSPAEK